MSCELCRAISPNQRYRRSPPEISAPSAAEATRHEQAIKCFETSEVGISWDSALIQRLYPQFPLWSRLIRFISPRLITHPPLSMSDNSSDHQNAKLTSSRVSAPWEPDFPDGGLQAWSVAAGAAGLMFCAFGYVNSFGVYQEYYQANQLSTRPPSDISWLGSLQVFFLFSGTVIGGPLFDRYGSVVGVPLPFTPILTPRSVEPWRGTWIFILIRPIIGKGTLAKCRSIFGLRHDDQLLQRLLPVSAGPGHFRRYHIRHDDGTWSGSCEPLLLPQPRRRAGHRGRRVISGRGHFSHCADENAK